MGIGFDIGFLYCPFENLSFGANLQDITTTLVAWNTGRNDLISPTVKIGSAYFIDLLGGRIAPSRWGHATQTTSIYGNKERDQ